MFSNPDPPMDLSHCVIEDHWFGQTVVVTCRGVLDMLTAPVLERHLVETVEGHPSAVVIDLTGVDFLASHGMSVLIASYDRVSDRLPLCVVADGPISRPLKLVGFDELMPMYARLDQALQQVQSDTRQAFA
jgi:anti-sigma B factor antagonist